MSDANTELGQLLTAQCDLMLIDLEMPVMGGLEAIQEVR